MHVIGHIRPIINLTYTIVFILRKIIFVTQKEKIFRSGYPFTFIFRVFNYSYNV